MGLNFSWYVTEHLFGKHSANLGLLWWVTLEYWEVNGVGGHRLYSVAFVDSCAKHLAQCLTVGRTCDSGSFMQKPYLYWQTLLCFLPGLSLFAMTGEIHVSFFQGILSWSENSLKSAILREFIWKIDKSKNWDWGIFWKASCHITCTPLKKFQVLLSCLVNSRGWGAQCWKVL